MAEANRFAVATGNFSATSTWSATSGGTAGASVPDTDQHAIIESGNNVTLDASDEIKSLTVNSGGTLTGNASYSLTINGEGDATYGTNGYAIKITGILGANVNFIITTAGGTQTDLIPASGSNVENLTISKSDGADEVRYDATGLRIGGDLTVTAGTFQQSSGGGAYSLTVDDDVSITGGTLSANGGNPDMTFGSLTIASGGTYSATSGTTNITSENGTKCFDNQTGGTFTHNNGTLKFASSIGDTTFDNAGADDFYNLTCETNGDCKYLNAITVLNNLTINHSNANFAANTDGSGAITVHGITKLVDGIAFSTSDDNANADHYGFIVIEGGTFRISDTSSATKTCDGIRNIGGTLSG